MVYVGVHGLHRRRGPLAGVRWEDSYGTLARPFRLVGMLAALAACSDGPGLGPDGPLFVTATLDGVAWAPDTAIAAIDGTRIEVIASRYSVLGTAAEEALDVTVTDFTGPTTYPLADPLSNAFGTLVIRNQAGVVQDIYVTRRTPPGYLRVASYRPTDSTLVGTFRLTVVSQVDSARSHVLVGTFRLRDGF